MSDYVNEKNVIDFGKKIDKSVSIHINRLKQLHSIETDYDKTHSRISIKI